MEFTTEQRKVLNAALDEYGIHKQSDIAIEEMAELTKAIIKCRRELTATSTNNLLEEIADALIMLEQLTIHYGTDIIAEYVNAKIARLNIRIEVERAKKYGGML